MNTKMYQQIETYMQTCMEDTAHDREHIYRVLYTALDIAETYRNVDYDILIAACLLHDIGRKAQFDDPSLCHAEVGGNMAYDFLLRLGWAAHDAEAVRDCVKSHRFRSTAPPQSLEAKILFDSDKLEATGGLGIARTLIYKGIVGEPLYTMNGTKICVGDSSDPESFFKEYNIKLKKLYTNFYTERGQELAQFRQQAATSFFSALAEEIESAYANRGKLIGILTVE